MKTADAVYILGSLLSQFRYPATPEAAMHEALERVLTDNSLIFRREVELGGRGSRIDFIVDAGGLSFGIECKVDGSPSTVAAQLVRYASAEQLDGLVLLTSRHTHAAFFAGRTECLGKPFRLVSTFAGSF